MPLPRVRRGLVWEGCSKALSLPILLFNLIPRMQLLSSSSSSKWALLPQGEQPILRRALWGGERVGRGIRPFKWYLFPVKTPQAHPNYFTFKKMDSMNPSHLSSTNSPWSSLSANKGLRNLGPPAPPPTKIKHTVGVLRVKYIYIIGKKKGKATRDP